MKLNSCLAIVLLASPLAAQRTWIVDDDGPADFVSVAQAVTLVADGDVILVREGVYQGAIDIDSKALTLQAEGEVWLNLFLLSQPTLKITDLAADQSVHFRGFRFQTIFLSETTTVEVSDCDGPVLFEDCHITGGGTSVDIQRSASVTFSRCQLMAPETFASFSPSTFFGFVTYRGLAALDSTVFLYDSEVAGSNGGPAEGATFASPPIPSGTAGAGVSLVGSNLFASGCTLRGGNGGGDPSNLCVAGADGAPALAVTGSALNPAPTATLRDSVLLGGTGGTGGCGLGNGLDAPATDVVAGTVDVLSGAARSFSVDSPVRESSLAMLHLAGEPGDVVVMYVQLSGAPGVYLPQFGCALHLPLPLGIVDLGALPASGQLDLPFAVPAMAPGLDSSRAVGQALFIGSTGFFEGGPTTLLILDSAL